MHWIVEVRLYGEPYCEVHLPEKLHGEKARAATELISALFEKGLPAGNVECHIAFYTGA